MRAKPCLEFVESFVERGRPGLPALGRARGLRESIRELLYANNGQGRLTGFQVVNIVAITARDIGKVGDLVDAAVKAAARAYPAWSETPPVVRARAMFRFKALLEEHFEELARIVTTEHGKTIDESRGSVRRGIECVEVACGAPSMLMGYGLENIATSIDCTVMRQPIGVTAAIAPFNFPAMVPLWFLPFAVACGNTFIVKPSEQVPLSQQRMFQLLEQCDLPPGVVNLVNGGREVVEAICDHPGIKGVSFVGSTPVARLVYQRATHTGKRCQALGGAKNFVIVMPDADLDRSIPIITESFYGCAGERCLAGSVLLPVGSAHKPARDRLIEAAAALKVGDGLEPGVTMGPVISGPHRDKVRGYVDRGVSEGASLALDGRATTVADRPEGYFIGPSVFDAVSPEMVIGREEIFGPVAAVCPVASLDEAIRVSDRLLLILSKQSIGSTWVKTEIAKARRKEQKLGRRVLFPVRLVSFEDLKSWEQFDSDIGDDSAKEIREYYLPDFSGWKTNDLYQPAFERLLAALKLATDAAPK
jgi:malonate-semialdehyde dehydrogenase (acetylating)/methylmalonate-semialdehyde dehydrogenase